MDQFYITLPSNSSEAFYPENTISQFRTKLHRAIELPENWEVGLCELIFPANWYNVVKGGNNVTVRKAAPKNIIPPKRHGAVLPGTYTTTEQLIAGLQTKVKQLLGGDQGAFFYENGRVKIELPDGVSRINLGIQLMQDLGMENPDITSKVTWNTKHLRTPETYHQYGLQIFLPGKEEIVGDPIDVTSSIPEGHYKTPDNLIQALNSLLVSTLSTRSLKRREGFYRKGKYVEVKLPSDDIEVELDWPLRALLGFKEKVISGTEKITGEYPFDVKNSFYSLFIYSDIIKPQVVGDTNAKLLQVTPAPQRTNTIISHTFNPVQYVPLERNNFETIEISIRNSAGDLVPFTTGLSIVKLHFRPRI